jgi:CDP-diacylglycerol--glycerol-3-phosphate 3-phosphatidyltransferase
MEQALRAGMQGVGSLQHVSAVSAANQISVCRLLLAPGVVASLLYYHPEREWLRFVALGLFVLGIASDALDGLLARSQHQETELGTLLDPIADKALILSAMISCSVITGLPAWMRIPAWFNLLVISRDVLLITGAVILFAIQGRWNVRPSWLGKWATFTQMLVVPCALLPLPLLKEPLVVIAAILTVLSAVSYIRMGIRVLG